MNKLEARILIENTGNYVEEEIDDVMEVYEELEKHLGWEDERRDSRYIVKFHDIFYYMDDEWEKEHEQELYDLFDMFCNMMYDDTKEEENYNNIDVSRLLASGYTGHYQSFCVDMPNITEENIVELTQDFYDEFNYEGKEYVKEHIKEVEILKSLEDHYIEYWFDFLSNEEFPVKVLKKMEEKYNKEKKEK